MPLFTYRAINDQNDLTTSTTSATSREEVAKSLQGRGLTPVSIRAAKQAKQSKKTIPIIEKITLSRYIATMLKSGLSITESISVLSEEASHPTTKKILDDLSFGIQHGQNLSAVLARYPNSFDNFFITIVKAGEISGTLSQAFEQIEKELRSRHSLSQKITGAMLYPAIVFIAMIGIGVLMFFFILPQIGQVFLNLNLPLSTPIKTLFKLSLFLNQFKLLILSSSFIFALIAFLFAQTNPGKRLLVRLLTPIPVIKNLIQQIDIARFCRIFSTLLKSGVPITESLDISLSALSYPKFRNSAKTIVSQVTKGQTLTSAFKTNKIFPPLLTQMIAAGEKSGTLDTTLNDLGAFYEEEVEAAVKKATQLLEPILMLVVGIGVGLMVLSVITPIYSVVSNLQANL